MEDASLNLIFAGLVLHEYTHIGDRKTNDGNITGTKKGDIGKQDGKGITKPSLYDHRGLDVERVVHGTPVDLLGDAQGEYKGSGMNKEFNRTGANFHFGQLDIKRIMKRISLTKQDTSGGSRKINVLPKDQKTAPRFK